MPDDRDFVQKMKSKLSKKEKALKYGQPYKQKWLAANERFLGKDKVEAALKEEADWEREYERKRNLETEPYAENQPKRSRINEPVRTIEDARRVRLYKKIREDSLKGYVSLKTSLGDLNLEIFCHQTPKTGENFIGLCKKGYYNNVTFHRLISGFMVQGGDPTGSGRGGESLWGPPFEDEIVDELSHDKPGILSMANAGKGTNKSQFFITFAPCTHLDGKHTIFGQLVGGMKVLKDIEKVPTNDMSQPKTPIVIQRAIVLANPYDEAATQMKSGSGSSSSSSSSSVAVEENPYLQHLVKK